MGRKSCLTDHKPEPGGRYSYGDVERAGDSNAPGGSCEGFQGGGIAPKTWQYTEIVSGMASIELYDT
jgi:hypothetical protein